MTPGSAGWRTVAVVACAAVVASCSTTSLSSPAAPVVEQLGQNVVRAGSGDVWAVVDYRYAAQSLGSEWLILEVAVTAADGRRFRLGRADIFLRTPSGARIPLPTQAEFSLAYNDLRGAFRHAGVAASPLQAYLPTDRRPCEFQFFAVPGTGITFDQVEINDRRACQARLPFLVPGGIQAGRWVLGIDLAESELRVPFDLS
jgi:hypothetical protein